MTTTMTTTMTTIQRATQHEQPRSRPAMARTCERPIQAPQTKRPVYSQAGRRSRRMDRFPCNRARVRRGQVLPGRGPSRPIPLHSVTHARSLPGVAGSSMSSPDDLFRSHPLTRRKGPGPKAKPEASAHWCRHLQRLFHCRRRGGALSVLDRSQLGMPLTPTVLSTNSSSASGGYILRR